MSPWFEAPFLPGGATLVTIATVLTAPSGAPAQIVEGRLLESGTRRAIQGGFVTLVDTAGGVNDVTLTDERGRFILRALGAGSYLVSAVALGYAADVDGILELGAGGYVQIDFYLRPAPLVVAGLQATVPRGRIQDYLERRGFYERQKKGIGYFIDPETLREWAPPDTQSLLRRIPRIRVQDRGVAGQTVSCLARDWVEPRVFVDGIQLGFIAGADLDEAVGIDHIAAMEIFTGTGQIPSQFAGTGTPCLILVWTKGNV